MSAVLISLRLCADGWALVRFRALDAERIEAYMLARSGAGGWEGVPLASTIEIERAAWVHLA